MVTPAETTPRVPGGGGNTDYFDTISPAGGLGESNLKWQMGLRRAFIKGRAAFEHYLRQAGVPQNQIATHVGTLFTGSPAKRKSYSAMARQGGYYGGVARNLADKQKPPTAPGDPAQKRPPYSPRQDRPRGVHPDAHSWLRHGPGGPAYRTGTWGDTRHIEYDDQNMGGYGPGGMISPMTGMSGFGPNFGPHGKLNPNLGRRVGDTHFSNQNFGGYGRGGIINPNSQPGYKSQRTLGDRYRGLFGK